MAETLSLSDLVGEHMLYAVDCSRDPDKHAEQIRFQLGRITYVAIEDPDDGYRSRLSDIITTKERMEEGRLSKPVPVVARMKADPFTEVLELVHARTGKLIVEVGTDNHDDYYPCWVAHYLSENLLA